jgi:hypothetical protein
MPGVDARASVVKAAVGFEFFSTVSVCFRYFRNIRSTCEDQGFGGKVVCAGAVAAVGVGEENESGFGCRNEPDGFY